jgi:hypothetical protein
MATLTELVDTIAEAEGMDSAAVALIARYAREARFIRKKGRGPSAAHMSVKDAANLLIAVNGSGAARDSAVVIPLYRNLILQEYVFADESQIPKNRALFGDVLELVIQSAIDGKLPDTFRPENIPLKICDAFQQGIVSLSVRFMRPEFRGTIIIGEYFAAEDVTGSHGIPLFFVPRRGRQNRALFQKLKPGDRADETRIGDRTVFSVARTLVSSPAK